MESGHSLEEVATWAAPASLRGQVLCVIRRRVPDERQVSSRIHANVHACLNVVASGQVLSGGMALPASFVTGPFSRPFETTVHGPLSSVSVVFQPWLLPPLFGIPAPALRDQCADLVRLRLPLAGDIAASCRELAESDAALEDVWRALAQVATPHLVPSLALECYRTRGWRRPHGV